MKVAVTVFVPVAVPDGGALALMVPANFLVEVLTEVKLMVPLPPVLEVVQSWELPFDVVP